MTQEPRKSRHNSACAPITSLPFCLRVLWAQDLRCSLTTMRAALRSWAKYVPPYLLKSLLLGACWTRTLRACVQFSCFLLPSFSSCCQHFALEDPGTQVRLFRTVFGPYVPHTPTLRLHFETLCKSPDHCASTCCQAYGPFLPHSHNIIMMGKDFGILSAAPCKMLRTEKGKTCKAPSCKGQNQDEDHPDEDDRSHAPVMWL